MTAILDEKTEGNTLEPPSFCILPPYPSSSNETPTDSHFSPGGESIDVFYSSNGPIPIREPVFGGVGVYGLVATSRDLLQSCQRVIGLRTPASLSIEVDARRWNVWRENLKTAPPRYISVELKECINAIFREIWRELQGVLRRLVVVGVGVPTRACGPGRKFHFHLENPFRAWGQSARLERFSLILRSSVDRLYSLLPLHDSTTELPRFLESRLRTINLELKLLREEYSRLGPHLRAVESPDLGPVVVITNGSGNGTAATTTSPDDVAAKPRMG